ncbi:unnamed protein product [Paramecium pentaurelia]|uniref:Uncharacterized protein n=1 Tax=Paramecium pentaurelia TaxID=43138 RepID=A0A8S1YQT9_9CILI|nr:unnamed protein product [Paramecium pentaurelia]
MRLVFKLVQQLSQIGDSKMLDFNTWQRTLEDVILDQDQATLSFKVIKEQKIKRKTKVYFENRTQIEHESEVVQPLKKSNLIRQDSDAIFVSSGLAIQIMQNEAGTQSKPNWASDISLFLIKMLKGLGSNLSKIKNYKPINLGNKIKVQQKEKSLSLESIMIEISDKELEKD